MGGRDAVKTKCRDRGYNEFQSLFWWMGGRDLPKWLLDVASSSVSILVLVDGGPGPGWSLYMGGDYSAFQSLFWWMGGRDGVHA